MRDSIAHVKTAVRMISPQMLIDGGRVRESETFPVHDPATQAVCGQAPSCDPERLELAVAAAARAARTWLNAEARRAALRAAADRLDAAAGELGAILTAEQGKPLRDAESEIRGSGYWLRASAELPLPGDETVERQDGAAVTVAYRPFGVVAAIVPWNFPVLLACWKIGPALLAGNTIVVKPSPYTPLATLRMGELLRDAFPPGVLNVISGGDDLGAALVRHPGVRKVTFTGSVAAGRQVALASAPGFKRMTLELGGNDAAIVLDDADPAIIAPRLFSYAFDNCGQICAAIKRVYVPRRMLGDFADAMAELALGVEVGPGIKPGTAMGPLTTRPQFDRVVKLVDEAVRDGARLITGGRPLDSPGNFYPPTLLRDAPDRSRIVEEEQFGPALPLLAYDDVDEAVERANDTRFGLCGSVWGTDVDRAVAVADRLECGAAYVNRHGDVSPHEPFGGIKDSGMGVENGALGLHAHLQVRVSHVAPKAMLSSSQEKSA